MKNKNNIFNRGIIWLNILLLLITIILSSCSNNKRDEIDLIEPE